MILKGWKDMCTLALMYAAAPERKTKISTTESGFISLATNVVTAFEICLTFSKRRGRFNMTAERPPSCPCDVASHVGVVPYLCVPQLMCVKMFFHTLAY